MMARGKEAAEEGMGGGGSVKTGNEQVKKSRIFARISGRAGVSCGFRSA